MSSTAVLVADLVESTALSTRLGEEAFEQVLQAHDDVAADVVAAHHGRIVKYLGDGFIAAFGAAGDALGCAEAFQQSMTVLTAAAREPVRARVGVSLGDVLEADGDLHGRAMAEAARLCAAAENGTILCTDVTSRAASGRPESDFGPTRTLDLKGLPPLDAREMFWDRDTAVERSGLTVEVLGPLRVARNGVPLDVGGPKERRVLAILAAHGGATVGLDTIVDGVWGDHPPRTATRSIHAYVARLRRAVEPARRPGAGPRVLVTDGRGYRLALAPDALDAARFERLVEEGRLRLAAGRPADAAAMLGAALELWKDVPYGDDLDVEQCGAESRRLVELHGLAREEHVAARLELGAAGDAIPEIEALVADAPLRERAWGFLIVALYRAGRQGDALRAYQRARRTLADELGVEPGPELRHLEAAVLAHDATLLARRSPRSGPHGGLPAPLDPGTTSLVGRDAELEVLRAAWARACAGHGGFVAVAGRAEMGKTRLVAALAAEAHRDGAIVLYAGSDPADRGPRALIRRALRSGGIDGSELEDDFDGAPGETFARLLPTWSVDEPTLLVLEDLHDADAATVAAIADIAEWSANLSLLVVATFRTDDDADVAGSAGAGQILLGPLTREAVGDIARRYGDTWTVDQVQALTDACGGLPVAAHRLAADWARAAGIERVDAAAVQAAAARRRLTATREDLADGVAELQRLLERRRNELPSAPAAPDDRRPPYRGLESFATDDAADYFGREHLVAELVACVATWPLVAVIGPSGSGKSSLARAGLVPAITAGTLSGSEDWGVAIVAPGGRPLAALAEGEAALAPADRRLLVVDPLEELWTACTDSVARGAFIDRLLALATTPETRVVVCLRSDFVGRVAEHPGLAAAVGAGTLLVSEMSGEELRRAVEGPARRRGLEVEPALVTAATADVAGRPGALPLLSTALLATWERRTGPVLTVQAYRDAGGVASALADLADACFETLTSRARDAARRILLRLASETAGTDVRIRATVADLATDADARDALDALVRRRLVTIDGEEAELTHEALLREWPRLVAWLDEDRAGRKLHRRIAEATHAWRDAGEDESELYRGTRLQGALEWAELRTQELTTDERAFLDASAEAAASEIRAAQAAAAREARRNRRLRVAVSGLAVLLVVAVASTGLAVRERSRADESTARARRQADVSDATRLATEARAAIGVQPDRALLLAAEAHGIHPAPVTESALQAALAATPASVESVVRFRVPSRYANLSPDARWVATSGDDDTLLIYNAREHRVVHRIPTATASPLAPVFSTDARRVAIGSAEGVVTVWDVTTGRRVGTPISVPGGGPAYGLFDPTDRRRLYTGGHDGTVTVWTLAEHGAPSPTPLLTIEPIHDPNLPLLVLASADGRRLAVGDPSGSFGAARGTTVWDVEDDRIVAVVPGTPGSFTADASTVVTSSGDSATRWDASSGAALGTVTGLGDAFPIVSLSPDGRYLAATDSSTNRVRVVDLSTGVDAIAPIELGWTDPIVRFLPDGRLYVVGGDGVAIARVDRLGVAPFARVLDGHAQRVVPAWATRPGTVVTATFDGPAREWDAVTGLPLADLHDPRDSGAWWALPSPDLRHVATIDEDGTVRIRDRRDRGVVTLPGSGELPDGVAWSPDGTRFARVLDRSLVVWQVRSGRDPRVVARVGLVPDDGPPGAGLTFSADGRRLAVVREFAPSVTLVDVRRDRFLRQLEIPALAVHAVAFSPDGHTLAAALGLSLGGESSVALYDVESGRIHRRLSIPFEPNGIAFTGAGDRFATLSRGRFGTPGVPGRSSFQLWDRRTLQPVGDPVEVPAFTADLSANRSGAMLVNGTDRSFAVAWDVDPARWQVLACRLAGRALTEREWHRYFPGRQFAPVCRA